MISFFTLPWRNIYKNANFIAAQNSSGVFLMNFSLPGNPQTYLSLSLFVRWQEGRKGSLNRVGTSTDRVTGITIIRALSVKANVVGRRNEEGLQQLVVGQLIDFCRNVQYTARHRHRTTKAKQSI